MDSVVIMGRKTYESIGKPLTGRHNFVITKGKIAVDNVYCFENIDASIEYVKKHFDECDVFVIGGESVYKQFLKKDLISKIYQTVIEKIIDGDSFFSFDKNYWKIVEFKKDEEITYITWEKKL